MMQAKRLAIYAYEDKMISWQNASGVWNLMA